MRTKPFMKKLDFLNTGKFEQISDNDFFGMLLCQRAIMLELQSQKDEQNHRREMVTDDRCVEHMTKSLPTSVKSKSVYMGQDVFDDYEEVLVNEGIIIGDENVEIVTAEPVCIQNNERNDASLNNNSVAKGLMPICSAGIDSADFSIFGDESRFNNYMDCSGKTVIECVEAYIQCKSTTEEKYKKVSEQFRSLLKYLKLVEKENRIKLMPRVIGQLFMDRFSNYMRLKELASGHASSRSFDKYVLL